MKEKYREVLSEGIVAPITWVFLQGNYELILDRMKARIDHFMPTALLTSQFDALELPENAINIDIAYSPEKIVEAVISRLKL